MSSYATRPTPGDTAWFTRDRFGMFIHWGLYALPARHEWVKTRERMTDADYDRYFRRFDPDLFDPRDWARQAKAAGMRYAVLTAKHHDGFCLFDSQYTDYKATNTPPDAIWCGNLRTPSAPRGFAWAFTTPCWTGITPISRSTSTIRAVTILTPARRTRAAAWPSTANTCGIRFGSC